MNLLLNNRNTLVLICILLLLNTGCIRFTKKPGDELRNSEPQSTNVVTHHEVKAGETLYSIAFEYGRDVRDVAAWNDINEPYTIYPDQKLRVIPIASDSRKKTKQSKSTARTRRTSQSKVTAKASDAESNIKPIWDWPTQGKIISTFLYRDPGRRGIDIVGAKGQPVYAAAAGEVVYRGNGLRGYGNLIILKHNESYFSAYAHTDDVVVNENEKVKLGQKLADMGDTGTDITKLHFEIRRNGKPVNPLGYLPKRR